MEIKLDLGDSTGIANSLGNLGLIQIKMNNYEEALENYREALVIFQNQGNEWKTCTMYNNMAELYLLMKRNGPARIFLDKGYEEAVRLQAMPLIVFNLELQIKYYESIRDTGSAYHISKKYITLKDSLINSEKINQIARIRENYESEKRIRENELMDMKMKVQEAFISKQRTKIWLSLLFVVILFVILIVLFNQIRIKRRAFTLLREQTEAVKSKNTLLENLNREVDERNRILSEQKSELEKVNLLKNKLISILTHNIRSPLNSLAGILHLVENGNLTDHEIKNIFHKIHQQIEQLIRFTGDVLHWSKSQMEGFVANPSKQDLFELIHNTCLPLQYPAAEKEVKFHILPFDSYNVFTDPDIFRIALTNLLENAIKFSFPGQEIVIRAEKTGKKATIIVEDSGKGMDKETIQQLFTHSTVSKSGTASEKGAGMGLIISKELIEKNNGNIWVSSEEGKGTRFLFTVTTA